ncbi:RNA-binding protein NOB1 [Cucumis melo var. makuwa]|uniref:RNA-binding protein NOB1 n=1 Tax=Cucumis melo var. makuwa TaxID=1194695 RepID=A0A5A7TH94_CUCMM|nr:RNA-binding protein NOB1 [Cucumis melo var. makuwa]
MESPSPASCWSNVVKTQPAPKPQHQSPTSSVQVFADSCKSSKGVAVAVVDANAIIQGGDKLSSSADKFVSVPEVLDEIRDPVSRHRLAFVPFTLESMDPSPDALNKVIKFARATGDLQTLSDVDIKLIALTYTLETQIHGTKHLRECPPPVHMVNTKRLPEKDMPGWGSNVPNLEEWEALEQDADDPSSLTSKILPLQDLNLNTIPSDGQSEDLSLEHKDADNSEHLDETESDSRRSRRYPPKKKEINIEGKKMVADGIDASQGQYDDNEGDWTPAVSRSTQRRYNRRKARREYYESLAEKDIQQDIETTNGDIQVESNGSGQSEDKISELPNTGNGNESQIEEEMFNNENLSEILKQMRLEEDSLNALHMSASTKEGSESEGEDMAVEGIKDAVKDEMEHMEDASQTNESVDTSNVDDVSSDQSWMLRSLSESSVACVTGDYAMQNVLLQMGLRLLAPGGMQIRQLHRWILKCHACYNVTAEIGRIFCPKCGNGGTLRKVAVTVGENGVVLAARKPRITLRGTKFSLPLPQGGRDAITKNLVLREDQLPQKFLHPKTKKKVNKQGDEFFAVDDFFSHHNTDKRAPLQPPVRQALAVFSGKRNPNDNHYSRSKHR